MPPQILPVENQLQIHAILSFDPFPFMLMNMCWHFSGEAWHVISARLVQNLQKLLESSWTVAKVVTRIYFYETCFLGLWSKYKWIIFRAVAAVSGTARGSFNGRSCKWLSSALLKIYIFRSGSDQYLQQNQVYIYIFKKFCDTRFNSWGTRNHFIDRQLYPGESTRHAIHHSDQTFIPFSTLSVKACAI